MISYSQEVENDQEHLDYSAFRLFVLRKGGQVISVATLRVFGTLFAEIPFVATKEAYRREGYCRRLISVRGLTELNYMIHNNKESDCIVLWYFEIQCSLLYTIAACRG
jgi:hypothetical protein